MKVDLAKYKDDWTQVILRDIVNDFHSILLKRKLVYSLRLTKTKQKNSVFGMLNSEVHHSVSA